MSAKRSSEVSGLFSFESCRCLKIRQKERRRCSLIRKRGFNDQKCLKRQVEKQIKQMKDSLAKLNKKLKAENNILELFEKEMPFGAHGSIVSRTRLSGPNALKRNQKYDAVKAFLFHTIECLRSSLHAERRLTRSRERSRAARRSTGSKCFQMKSKVRRS